MTLYDVLIDPVERTFLRVRAVRIPLGDSPLIADILASLSAAPPVPLLGLVVSIAPDQPEVAGNADVQIAPDANATFPQRIYAIAVLHQDALLAYQPLDEPQTLFSMDDLLAAGIRLRAAV